MPSLLSSDDQAYRCVNSMRQLLENLPIQDVMVNGNIEMVLKSFLSAGWKSAASNVRACLLDKEFNGASLDLVAFENGNVVFWLEAKCTFMQDNPRVTAASERAVNQIIHQYEPRVQNHSCAGHLQFAQASRYIIHFLTSVPNNNPNIPQWAWPDYPGNPAYHPRALEQSYEGLLGNRFLASIYLPVFLNPGVYAVIIKLTPPPQIAD